MEDSFLEQLMPLSQALHVTSMLLASASFIGLTLGAGLPEWLAALTGAALIAVLLRNMGIKPVDRLATQMPVSAAGWNLIVLGGFVGFWIDLLWVSGDLLPAGLHFLMILMVIKLFNLRLRRDYLHLYAISLVSMLASGSLTTDLWFFPIFSIYLLAGVWTLLLFQLTKTSEVMSDTWMPAPVRHERHEESDRVSPRLFWIANGLALGAFLITVVIFFTIPRVNAGIYQKGFGENVRTSGFSDKVNLGAIGSIKRDPSIVMRVELPRSSLRDARPLYIRGVSFDRYDGKVWTNQLSYRRSLIEESPGTFTLRGQRAVSRSQLGEAIQQKILLEPLDTPVLFAAPFIESVTGMFPGLFLDATGAVYLPFPSSSRIEYTVMSRSNVPVPADLVSSYDPGSYPEWVIRHYMQLPRQSDRINALAGEVTQGQRNSHEKAIAIQTYLTSNYRYSLDAPLAKQNQPLEEFLFTRKTGYCEHYATAMVIMLRAVGVPARLVTGFMATEWNDYGNYYVVRQQDAHAWVEVYLPHSGWISMDPTPTEDSPGTGGPVWKVLGPLVDNIKLQWNRLFVQYSAADQLAVVRELKAEGMSVRSKALDSMTAFFGACMAVLGGIVTRDVSWINIGFLGELLGFAVLSLAVLLWVGRRRQWGARGFWKASRGNELVISQYYRRMRSYLSGQGVSSSIAIAPLELVEITHARWREAHFAVASITELYCRTRFGHIPLTREDLNHAEDQLRHLLGLRKPHV
jgi:protein-glutamine gamma-glutamyltransferase